MHRLSRPFQMCAVALAVLLSCPLAVGSPRPAFAQELPRTIVLGESNSPDQQLELLTLFDARGPDNVEVVTADEATTTLSGLIEGGSDGLGGAMLVCGDPGSGLVVDVTGDTQIPAAVYALLLVSSGVVDGTLQLAAPSGSTIDGLTPLAGIIASLDTLPCGEAAADPGLIADAAAEAGLAINLGERVNPDDPRAGMESAVSMLVRIIPLLPDDPANLERMAQAINVGSDQAGVELDDATRSLLQGFFADHPDIAAQDSTWAITPGDEPGSLVITAQDAGPTPAATEPAAIPTATEEPEATALPPTETAVPPTATPEPPTATPVPPTATSTATPSPTPTLSPAQIAAIEVEQTATAEAAATMYAAATATAVAETNAAATVAAAATATAIAPTATPAPLPTRATESVIGTVVSAGRASLTIKPENGTQSTYRVDPKATRSGIGGNGNLTDLQAGQRVTLSVDQTTGVVHAVTVNKASGITARTIGLLLGAILALGILATLILRRRSGDRSTFIVVRRGDE